MHVRDSCGVQPLPNAPSCVWLSQPSCPVVYGRRRHPARFAGRSSRQGAWALGGASASAACAAQTWALLQPTLAALAPLPPPAILHHVPRMADIINVCMMAAAAGGSCVLATAKYLHESGMRRASLSPAAAELSLLHGVDISSSKYMKRPKVQAAADFAAAAHTGQHRRTGEPYICHCVHTAAIVEDLMAQNHVQEADQRAETAIIAALLHDTLDDTHTTLEELHEAFGPQVATCVENVSRLSMVNQMLRRHLRQRANGEVGQAQRLPLQEAEALRHMMVCLTDEPLVLTIKLADRLHNMRTCHALKPDKRAAVAIETLEVWCSLAEQLGMFPLKAELEDLCFAVLQPAAYTTIRSQLDELWGISSQAPNTLPAHLPPPPALQPSKLPQTSQPEPGSQAKLPLLAAAARLQLPSPPFKPAEPAAAKPGGLIGEDPVQLPGFMHDCPTMYIDEGAQRPSRDGSASASTIPLTMTDDEAWAQVFMLLRSRKELRRMQQHPVRDALQDPADLPQYAADGLPRPRKALRSKYETPQAPGHASRKLLQQAASSWAESQAAGDKGARHTAPPAKLTEEQTQVHELLKTVAPFGSTVFKLPVRGPAAPATAAMGPLVGIAYALRQELNLSHAAVGLDIQMEARLKSLYSTHRKMQRKGVPVASVYDVRALRVIVSDAGRRLLPDAAEACYAILPVVHRLWRQVLREADDYIANPTASGYQSLHTAVTDARGIPMEVQIRTSSMHEVAEYGPAAHWAYKARGANPINPVRTVQVGMPVMRSDGGKLRLGVVLGSEREARELHVAIKNGSRLLPGAQVSAQECRNLMQYVESHGWDHAGAGDWNVRLERYLLCADGKYHAVDFFDRRQHVTVTPIYGWKNGFFAPDSPATPAHPPTSRTEAHYQSIQAEYLAETGRLTHQAPLLAQLPHLKSIPRAGTPLVPRPSSPQAPAQDSKATQAVAAPRSRRTDANKIRALRRKLENVSSSVGASFTEADSAPKDISVFLWPAHRIVHLPEGTTAGHVLRTQGSEAALQELASDGDQDLINVNNQLVPASTPLTNGDYVVFSKQRLDTNRSDA